MKMEKVFVKENLTVPNLLSCLRILVIAPLVKFIMEESYIMAGLTLLVSAVSDMLDGMIARRFHQVTPLGKMLDPVADKLTLVAIVISLSFADRAVFRFAAVLFTKELLMLCGGFMLLKMGMKPPAAKWYGKMATVIFYVSVTLIVLLKAVWGIADYTLTVVLFSITTSAMLFSLVMYTRIFLDMLKNRDDKG